tara:strand:- start:1256 stop:1888 length:633 start_codon:yes stop_codon:yes gene_type:complete
MLFCENLFFERPDFTLKGSFCLKKGERVALTGPSGHGKTTLLLVLAGFLNTQKGSLFYNQEDIMKTPPEKRPFAFLFQENNLFDHLTILENMALAFGRFSPGKDEQNQVTKILSLFKVNDTLKWYPHNLSGGQRRRISLARCLLLRRPVLLLDEPFNGVDQETVDLLITFLTQTNDLTIIFTSHQDREVAALATRVLKINQGLFGEGKAF